MRVLTTSTGLDARAPASPHVKLELIKEGFNKGSPTTFKEARESLHPPKKKKCAAMSVFNA